MKIDGFTDRQVADRIREMPGGIDYNIKTIATRHKRLQVAAAKKREEELDAQLTDWHDGDVCSQRHEKLNRHANRDQDEALFKAKDKAEKEIRRQQKALEEVHKWRLIAQYLKQAKPASAYSQNACRKRIVAISKGFAASPPELEDTSLASTMIRHNRHAAKAAKGRSDKETARVIQSTKNLSVVSPIHKQKNSMVAKKLNRRIPNSSSPYALGLDGNGDSDATIEDSVLTDVDELEDIDADDEAGPADDNEDMPIKRAAVPPISRRTSTRKPVRRANYMSSTTEDSNDDAEGEITSDESSASESNLSVQDTTNKMEEAANPTGGRTAKEQAEMDKQREHEEWEVKIGLGMVAIEDTPLYDGRSRIPPFKPALLPFFEGSIKTKSGVYHGIPAAYRGMIKESEERAAIAREEASDPAKERAAMALQFVPNRGPTAPKIPEQPVVQSTRVVTLPSLVVPAKLDQGTKRGSNFEASGPSAKKPKLSDNGKKAANATKNNQGLVSSALAGSATEMSRAEQEFARTHLTRLLTTDKKIRDDPKAWDTHLFDGLSQMTCKWIFKMKEEVDPDWVLEPKAHRKWYEYATTTFPELFNYGKLDSTM